MSIEHYLAGNHYSEIEVGQSGADVYEINGDLILKHVERQKLKDALFDTYTREALFYQAMADNRRNYLPQIIELKISNDEIILLMKKYRTPNRNVIDKQMIRKVAETLARVHTDGVPEFLNRFRPHSDLLSEQQIEAYRAGWEDVLKEHPGSFDASLLKLIATKINPLIAWNDTEEKVLIHGDFHWDNLLEDENGGIRVCDWQSVGLGEASGDISFFMSRLESDCANFDLMYFLQCYGDAIQRIGGNCVDIRSIARHIAAANVITSFVFWHRFLHGAETERVRDIYRKMTDDFQRIDSVSI